MKRRLRVARSRQSLVGLGMTMCMATLMTAALCVSTAHGGFAVGKTIVMTLCAVIVVYCGREILRLRRCHAAVRSEVATGVMRILTLCDGRPIKTTVYRDDTEYTIEVGRKPHCHHLLSVKIHEEQREQNRETGHDDTVVYKRAYVFHTLRHTVRYGVDVTYRRVTAGNLQQVRMTADKPEEVQTEFGDVMLRDMELERLNAAYNLVSPRDLEQLAELLAAPVV